MPSPIKDPIPSQDKKTLELKQYQCLTSDVPPFLPGMKLLRNEKNDDDPETIETSHSDKDDTSHNNRDDSIENIKEMKNINYHDEYKEDTSKHQDGNESVDNPEISDTSRNESFFNTTKKRALIKPLIFTDFKHHVIHYVIDIVSLCGEK